MANTFGGAAGAYEARGQARRWRRKRSLPGVRLILSGARAVLVFLNYDFWRVLKPGNWYTRAFLRIPTEPTR